MMNKLALSTLCLGVLFQANCVIETEPAVLVDAGVLEEDAAVVVEGAGVFEVSWEVTPACPAGAAVEIHAQNTISQMIFTDIYNCTDGIGAMSSLPLAAYDVWIDITSTDSTILLAQSLLVGSSLDIDGDVVRVDLPTFSVDEGFFGFTWTVNDAAGPTTCDAVFADTVSIEATMVNSNSAIRVGLFTCADGQAVTDPLAVGEYEVFMDILQGQDLLGSSLMRTETIEWGNQLKDIGNFDFLFQ